MASAGEDLITNDWLAAQGTFSAVMRVACDKREGMLARLVELAAARAG